MDEIKGDGDEGLKYVYLGDSGVIHVKRPTRWDEESPEKKSERAQAEIDRLLKVSDVFRVRTEIRNSLRGWHEKIQWLAEMLEYPYIPKMSAQEVYDEHQMMVERKVQRASFAERDTYPAEALLILQEDSNLEKDERTLTKEEYAKKTAYIFKWYIKHVGYEAAADRVKWILAGMEDIAAKGEVIESVRLVTGKVLSDLIRQKHADEAAKAFMELGTVCRLERADLYEVKDCELKNPVVQKAFLKSLAGVIELDPGLSFYPVVRDHMSEMGFFTEEDAAGSFEVEAKVGELLKKSMEELAVYYRETLNALEKAGLKGAAAEEISRGRMVLVGRLVKKMRQSPRYYAVIRAKWEKWGLISPEDLEGNRAIPMLYSEHLQRCFEKHPFYYNKMKYHWKEYGLVEDKSEEVGHTMSANWAVRPGFVTGEAVGDDLLQEVDDEKNYGERLVLLEEAAENANMIKYAMEWEAKRREFAAKYPQYADDV